MFSAVSVPNISNFRYIYNSIWTHWLATHIIPIEQLIVWIFRKSPTILQITKRYSKSSKKAASNWFCYRYQRKLSALICDELLRCRENGYHIAICLWSSILIAHFSTVSTDHPHSQYTHSLHRANRDGKKDHARNSSYI